MPKEFLNETELTALAKKYRKETGRRRAQAARDMGVSQTSIFHAEESPEQGLMKLRARMINMYSPFRVEGPCYVLRRKR
jgi:DNA-binding XRE family transcriptional regulator